MAKDEEAKSFVSFYRKGATIHMSLKISKDGESRKEDESVLKGMYDEFGNKIRRGAKVRDALIDLRNDNNEDVQA